MTDEVAVPTVWQKEYQLVKNKLIIVRDDLTAINVELTDEQLALVLSAIKPAMVEIFGDGEPTENGDGDG